MKTLTFSTLPRARLVILLIAAETVQHLQQAVVLFKIMLTDAVKLMQLCNFLSLARHVEYDRQI